MGDDWAAIDQRDRNTESAGVQHMAQHEYGEQDPGDGAVDGQSGRCLWANGRRTGDRLGRQPLLAACFLYSGGGVYHASAGGSKAIY